MSKINASGWKEFKLSDYFDICYGSFIPKKYRGDKTPFVTTTSNNNGIDYYVDSDPMFEGDALTVASDGSVGATYYHDKPFSAGNIVVVLEPTDDTRQAWTPNSAQFLATVIRRFAEIHYGWQNKFSVNRVRDAKVPLPVTSTGEPDWDYMDEYIEKLATQAHKNVSSLATLKPVEHKIDIKAWKEFKVGDLINFDSSAKIYHAEHLDILDKPEDLTYYPYVVRTAFNNGIKGYIKEDPNTLNPANTISFAQDTAQLFYQDTPYFTGNKIKICTIKDHDLTKNIATFLISVLLNGFDTFSYDSSFNVATLSRVNIKLPVTSTGQPDFDYMEKYIDNMQSEAHESLELLKQI